MLEARGLSIGYASRAGRKVVQSGLHLALRPGQMAALVGPNGSGKSTLLRTLALLQPPLHGAVYADGREAASLSLRERARLLSVVLTDRVDVPHLTVRMLVALGRNPYTGWAGKLSGADEDIVQRALQSVQMLHLAARPVASLSDGERQRALVARALAQDTPYILLDEPTAHLDVQNRIATMLLLGRLAHTLGKGILLSTHELDLALQTADRLWLMRPAGGLVEGTPDELVQSGELQRTFSGEAFFFDPATRRFVVRAR